MCRAEVDAISNQHVKRLEWFNKSEIFGCNGGCTRNSEPATAAITEVTEDTTEDSEDRHGAERAAGAELAVLAVGAAVGAGLQQAVPPLGPGLLQGSAAPGADEEDCSGTKAGACS